MKLRCCSLLIMILMLLVSNNITTASAQPQAMKDVGQSSVVGEWVGGTDALGTWRFIQARFARDARGLKGSLDAQSANVMRLPLRTDAGSSFPGDCVVGLRKADDGRRVSMRDALNQIDDGA